MRIKNRELKQQWEKRKRLEKAKRKKEALLKKLKEKMRTKGNIISFGKSKESIKEKKEKWRIYREKVGLDSDDEYELRNEIIESIPEKKPIIEKELLLKPAKLRTEKLSLAQFSFDKKCNENQSKNDLKSYYSNVVGGEVSTTIKVKDGDDKSKNDSKLCDEFKSKNDFKSSYSKVVGGEEKATLIVTGGDGKIGNKFQNDSKLYCPNVKPNDANLNILSPNVIDLNDPLYSVQLRANGGHDSSAQLSDIKATQTPGSPIELSLKLESDKSKGSMFERCIVRSENLVVGREFKATQGLENSAELSLEISSVAESDEPKPNLVTLETYAASPGSTSTAPEIKKKKVVNLSIVSKPPSTLIADCQNELNTSSRRADKKFIVDFYGQVGGNGRLDGDLENSGIGFESLAHSEPLIKLPSPNAWVGTELGDSGQKTKLSCHSGKSYIKTKSKVIGEKISTFLDVYEGPKVVDKDVNIPFLRQRSKSDVQNCSSKLGGKDTQSHLLVSFDDGIKGIINTDSKFISDDLKRNINCQTRTTGNSSKVIELNEMFNCHTQPTVSSECSPRLTDSNISEKNCQAQTKTSSNIIKNSTTFKSQSIRDIIARFSDNESRSSDTRFTGNNCRDSSAKKRRPAIDVSYNKDIEVIISPVKPNRGRKISSVDKILRHNKKDDSIKKLNRTKVQMIVTEIETKIEPKKMKSQGSQPKIFSARKNVKNKLGANPNQPQITAFYRAIEKNDCELQEKE